MIVWFYGGCKTPPFLSGDCFMEYPKMLYKGGGETLVVSNEVEEKRKAVEGWQTAAVFFQPAKPAVKEVVSKKA